jgi:hypothetical protein
MRSRTYSLERDRLAAALTHLLSGLVTRRGGAILAQSTRIMDHATLARALHIVAVVAGRHEFGSAGDV